MEQLEVTAPVEQEEWRNIPGLPGFMASSLGRVAKILNHKSSNGYLHAHVSGPLEKLGLPFRSQAKHEPSTKVTVHLLVAITFLGPPPEGMNQINHKDRNRHNNHPSNLEWTNYQGNAQHFWDDNLTRGSKGLHKYTVEQYLEARRLREEEKMSYQKIADRMGITRGGVEWMIKGSRRAR